MWTNKLLELWMNPSWQWCECTWRWCSWRCRPHWCITNELLVFSIVVDMKPNWSALQSYRAYLFRNAPPPQCTSVGSVALQWKSARPGPEWATVFCALDPESRRNDCSLSVHVWVLEMSHWQLQTSLVYQYQFQRCIILSFKLVHPPAEWGWNNPRACSCGRGSALSPSCSSRHISAPGWRLDASTGAAGSSLTFAPVQKAQPLGRSGIK